MREHLPPLNAVKVFDAVVQNGSLSAAARNLQISQSAVSKHIQNLEAFLGCNLLHRSRSGVQLTPRGKKFHAATGPALVGIHRAAMNCRTAASGVSVLKISAPATLALHWLAPRLAVFHKLKPNIVIDLTVSDKCPDFSVTDHDGALVPMSRKTAPAHWIHFLDEIIIPVCSPTLVQEHPITNASDIRTLPKIHTNTRPELWPNWLEMHNQQEQFPNTIPGFGFQDYYLSIASAKAGLGLALVPRFLVVREITTGELIQPIEHSLNTDHSYWFATKTKGAISGDLKVFFSWLADELSV